MLNNYTIQEVQATINNFEAMKHIDEYGNEYWLAHEVARALGYNQYQQFKPVIERAKIQMYHVTQGQVNLEYHFSLQTEMVQIGSGAMRSVPGYRLSRHACYSITLEADSSKPAVAIAKEYFIINTRSAEMLLQRLNDKNTIDARHMISNSNRQLTGTLLSHEVPENKLGTVISRGDKEFYGMTTQELKEDKGIPNNRPVADFAGDVVNASKFLANKYSQYEIERDNLYGVDETAGALERNNREMREATIRHYGVGPEEMITMEDSKKVERRYNNITKKKLEELESKYF